MLFCKERIKCPQHNPYLACWWGIIVTSNTPLAQRNGITDHREFEIMQQDWKGKHMGKYNYYTSEKHWRKLQYCDWGNYGAKMDTCQESRCNTSETRLTPWKRPCQPSESVITHPISYSSIQWHWYLGQQSLWSFLWYNLFTFANKLLIPLH